MKNQIWHISSIKNVDLAGYYVAQIDGARIQTKIDYLSAMEQSFHLPPCNDSWDGCLDWMRDLEWVQQERIALVIYNSSKLFLNDEQLKTYMMADFEEDILPFWEEEVKHVVVGGRPKEFQVYLVD